MNDQNLRLTRTHSADGFQGSLFGVNIEHFKWVALALLAGLSLFAGLFYGLNFGFVDAGKWSVVPAIVCVAYLRLGHQNRPPGFFVDLLDTLITGGHALPPRQPTNRSLPYV